MEVKTSMATCINGHHYDGAKHACCPKCGALPAGMGSFTPTEAPGGGGMGSFIPTEAPMGGAAPAGNFSPTEAPMGVGPATAAAYNPGFGATTPPEGDRYGNINPFSVETMIGGDQNDGGQAEPVVGWLVCIEGPVRGVDYRIHAGYNYIGREMGDIHIQGDQQISRQNHAMIAYDSSEHTYFVGPAAGRNLIKVNGKTVLNAVEIQSYDIISIGTTKLIFVALCGEKFSWNQEGRSNG